MEDDALLPSGLNYHPPYSSMKTSSDIAKAAIDHTFTRNVMKHS